MSARPVAASVASTRSRRAFLAAAPPVCHSHALRSVTVERYESDRTYIAAGLSTGERVVTAGVHRLAPGDKVKLLAAAP